MPRKRKAAPAEPVAAPKPDLVGLFDLEEFVIDESCPVCGTVFKLNIRRPESRESVFKRFPCSCRHAYLFAAWARGEFDFSWVLIGSPELEEVLYQRYVASGGF